jgi:hypothetical protein
MSLALAFSDGLSLSAYTWWHSLTHAFKRIHSHQHAFTRISIHTHNTRRVLTYFFESPSPARYLSRSNAAAGDFSVRESSSTNDGLFTLAYVDATLQKRQVRIKRLEGPQGGMYLASCVIPQTHPSLQALVRHYSEVDRPDELPVRLRMPTAVPPAAALSGGAARGMPRPGQQPTGVSMVDVAVGGAAIRPPHARSSQISGGGARGPQQQQNVLLTGDRAVSDYRLPPKIVPQGGAAARAPDIRARNGAAPAVSSHTDKGSSDRGGSAPLPAGSGGAAGRSHAPMKPLNAGGGGGGHSAENPDAWCVNPLSLKHEHLGLFDPCCFFYFFVSISVLITKTNTRGFFLRV